MCHFISDNSFHISPKYTYQPPLCRIQHWLICYLATSETYQTFCYSSWSIHQINLLFSQHIAQHMLFLLRAPRITCWYLAHWLTSFLRFYHLSSSLWYSSELVRPWKTIHLRACRAYTTSCKSQHLPSNQLASQFGLQEYLSEICQLHDYLSAVFCTDVEIHCISMRSQSHQYISHMSSHIDTRHSSALGIHSKLSTRLSNW